MSRFDVFKSLVRSAADVAIDRVADALPVTEARRLIDRIRQQQAWIREDVLTSAAAHADGVRQASVSCTDGSLLIDATLESDRDVQFRIHPTAVHFAPGGAKEIGFEIEPMAQVSTEIVSAVAGCVAQATWPMAFTQGGHDVAGAIVERESDTRVRVDLRTVPAVRRFAAKGPAAMVLDVMQLESIRCDADGMVLKLKLPQLVP